MSSQISSLNYEDSTSAGRKITQLVAALDEVDYCAIGNSPYIFYAVTNSLAGARVSPAWEQPSGEAVPRRTPRGSLCRCSEPSTSRRRCDEGRERGRGGGSQEGKDGRERYMFIVVVVVCSYSTHMCTHTHTLSHTDTVDSWACGRPLLCMDPHWQLHQVHAGVHQEAAITGHQAASHLPQDDQCPSAPLPEDRPGGQPWPGQCLGLLLQGAGWLC